MQLRIDPHRRSVLAVAGCVGLVALITLGWVLSSRPRAALVAAVASPSAVPATSTASDGSPRNRPPDVVVDVAGRVRHPGVYRLPAGSRVIDAVRKAGGALAGVSLTEVNLAAVLVDGEQVAVGVVGAVASAGGAATADGASARAGPVSLNTATVEQLDALPGVGPVLAQHILDFRAAHGGRFERVDQLNEVDGIGPAKFATLRALVTV